MVKWRKPVYKVLADSELGAGHTSGVVPVKRTQNYFGRPIKKRSHKIKEIFVEFWHEGKSETIKTNVNYFSSRTHEHIHLTGGGLMPLYKSLDAKRGDIIIFWKSVDNENYFKAELIKFGSEKWRIITGDNPSKKGGFTLIPPPGKPRIFLDITRFLNYHPKIEYYL